MTQRPTAFVNARLVDPASGWDGPGALLVQDGKIADVAQGRDLGALSADIEAQYADLERHLGRARLTQLYGLLDELIALQEAGDEGAAHELLETAA